MLINTIFQERLIFQVIIRDTAVHIHSVVLLYNLFDWLLFGFRFCNAIYKFLKCISVFKIKLCIFGHTIQFVEYLLVEHRDQTKIIANSYLSSSRLKSICYSVIKSRDSSKFYSTGIVMNLPSLGIDVEVVVVSVEDSKLLSMFLFRKLLTIVIR